MQIFFFNFFRCSKTSQFSATRCRASAQLGNQSAGRAVQFSVEPFSPEIEVSQEAVALPVLLVSVILTSEGTEAGAGTQADFLTAALVPTLRAYSNSYQTFFCAAPSVPARPPAGCWWPRWVEDWKNGLPWQKRRVWIVQSALGRSCRGSAHAVENHGRQDEKPLETGFPQRVNAQEERALASAEMTSVPSSVPKTVPEPPKIFAPPTRTAVIAANSKPIPALD